MVTREASSSIDVVATTATSTSSSTDYIGALFVECTYDVMLPEGGSFETLEFVANGRYAFNHWNGSGCELLEAAGDAELEEYERNQFRLSGVDGPIAPGAHLFRCTGEDLISKGDEGPTIGYTDIEVWGELARSHQGIAMRPPRLCVTNIDCDGEPYDFNWKGVPKCADADYNEIVATGDALGILQVAVGIRSCRPIDSPCDPSGDGSTTAKDALLTLRFLVGQPVQLECRLPCYPDTIGRPGSDREFRVTFAHAAPTEVDTGSTIRIAPGVALSGPSDCWAIGQYVPGHSSIAEDGSLVFVLQKSDVVEPLAVCIYQASGDYFPDASDFLIESATEPDDLPVPEVVVPWEIRTD